MKLSRLDTKQKIVDAVKNTKAGFTFLSSPKGLDMLFNNVGFELWSVEHEEELYIFVEKVNRKLWQGEIRLLFKIFPDELIEKLKAEFDSPFIAYNELLINPEKENQAIDEELIVDLEKYVSLENKNIRKHYKQAVKYNTGLVFKDFKNISMEHLRIFWSQWVSQRASRPFAADRTHNDARFFENYKDNEYFGIGVYDKDLLVGYSVGVKFDEIRCLSFFNKCLRGYRNLGLQVSYLKAQQALDLGFKFMALGATNNEFKKQFTPISSKQYIYGYEIFRKPEFKTKTENGYTRALFM